MITASIWVPRGSAADHPTKYHIDENELARISALAKLQLDDAKTDLDGAKNKRGNAAVTEDSSDEEENGVRSQGYRKNSNLITWVFAKICTQRRR